MKKLLLFLLLIPFFGYSQTKRYKSGDWTYVDVTSKKGDAFDGYEIEKYRYAYVCNTNTCLYIRDWDITDKKYDAKMYIDDRFYHKSKIPNSPSIRSIKNDYNKPTPIYDALSAFYEIQEDWEEYEGRSILDKTRDLINGNSDSRFEDIGLQGFSFSIKVVYNNEPPSAQLSSSEISVEYNSRDFYKNQLDESKFLTAYIFLDHDFSETYFFKGDFYTWSQLKDYSDSDLNSSPVLSFDEILEKAGKSRKHYRSLQTNSSISFRLGHTFDDNLTTQTFSLKGSTKAIRFVLGL